LIENTVVEQAGPAVSFLFVAGEHLVERATRSSNLAGGR
jgi:hypothetical protein